MNVPLDKIKIGIIGGSGLEKPGILKDSIEVDASTRFGKPSSPLTLGKLNGVDVAILSRHGIKHQINPSNVNYRANILALKEQGCTHIFATSACGSLREEIKPGDFVFCDQFIDRTTKRQSTFYEDKVCHIPMEGPFCKNLRDILFNSAKSLKLPSHKNGTVVTIEGPRFSTQAESMLFRTWGADVINMSTVPEAVLAREAGICYAVIAMSTDYDCWKKSEKVSISKILDTMKKNSENVKRLIADVVEKINYSECKCKEDIKSAVIG